MMPAASFPHAQFYPNQGLDACLDCLRQAVAARGVPVRLYIDNAKIYRSQQLARIAASLGISIVHTPPYQPEGRGKIERYFRTVRDQFLTNLDPKQSLSLDELNDRLRDLARKRLSPLRAQRSGYHSAAALAARYRTRPPTPAGHRSPPPLLLSPRSPGAPRLHFPAAQPLSTKPRLTLAGETVEVRFDPLDAAEVEIHFQGKLQGTARLVDPVVNAGLPPVKRAATAEPEPTGINFVELLNGKKKEEE